MHVKNHMALWFLWFLWFLRVECSSNPLYKPLCEFLVFVDLLWFLCGSACGFWSRVVFGSGLRVRSCSCGFLVLVCASDRAHVVFVGRWSARPIVLMWFFGSGLRVRSCSCGFCGSVVLFSMLDADGCASYCSLWTAKKICPSPHFVLCSVSSPLGATFTNGENDHG